MSQENATEFTGPIPGSKVLGSDKQAKYQHNTQGARMTSHKHNNMDLTESPTATVTRHARKYKVYKLRQSGDSQI